MVSDVKDGQIRPSLTLNIDISYGRKMSVHFLCMETKFFIRFQYIFAGLSFDIFQCVF